MSLWEGIFKCLEAVLSSLKLALTGLVLVLSLAACDRAGEQVPVPKPPTEIPADDDPPAEEPAEEPAAPEEPASVGIVFPDDAGVINVTNPPYNAVPNDELDDTAALQAALAARPNANTIVYLPNGTYLVSERLNWPSGKQGSEEKRTILQGQSRDGVVIRLADNAPGYSDSAVNKAVLWTGQKPAQRFRNAVRNLTVNVGANNPGAVGIKFIANNQGGLRNVAIISEDGQGVYGLDLSYTDEIGPMLIKNLYVRGFDVGIRSYWQTASITFEGVELESQNVLGWENSGQMVFVRRLKSRNAVTAFRNVKNSPAAALIVDANLTGISEASEQPAIHNQRTMFLRDVVTRGYARTVLHDDKGRGNEPGVVANVDEWTSHGAAALFEQSASSLNLPILETPEVPWGELDTWVSPLAYGGLPNDGIDDTAAIQAALDSGAHTVYLPNGTWRIDGTVRLRGEVTRLTGTEASLTGDGTIELLEGNTPVVIIERFNVSLESQLTFVQASERSLVLSSILYGGYRNSGNGDLFIEDVAFSSPVTFRGQRVWARQLNQETDAAASQVDAKIVNDNSQLWILGLKTEQAGTAIKTINGGVTELLGGFIFSNGAVKTKPMFELIDASSSLAGVSTRCFYDTCFETFIRETQDSEVKELSLDELGDRTLYVAR